MRQKPGIKPGMTSMVQLVDQKRVKDKALWVQYAANINKIRIRISTNESKGAATVDRRA